MASSSSTPPLSVAAAAASDANPNSSPLESIRIVKIRVVCKGHKTVIFKLKSNLPIKMLVDEYFRRSPLLRGDVDLTYNGERLNVLHTPDKLAMKDNATIEAMVRVHGGGMKL